MQINLEVFKFSNIPANPVTTLHSAPFKVQSYMSDHIYLNKTTKKPRMIPKTSLKMYVLP